MPRGYRDYEESLKEGLRDPKEAASYLNACLAGGSREVFLLALRQGAAAHGIGSVAKQTDLGRESHAELCCAQAAARKRRARRWPV